MRVDLLWALDALMTGSVLFLSGFTLRHHVTLSRMRQEVQTAQRELENRLGTIQQQTGFDALTGLHNPQMFQAKLSTLLRGKEPLALIYMDQDGLKSVNDSRGHAAGDEMIRLAVRRWAALDNLFRRGSAADEFFLIVERARITVGIQLAEQLLSTLRAVGLSASFGVIEWDGQSIVSASALELAAEQQMQRKKHDGRGCVRWNASRWAAWCSPGKRRRRVPRGSAA